MLMRWVYPFILDEIKYWLNISFCWAQNIFNISKSLITIFYFSIFPCVYAIYMCMYFFACLCMHVELVLICASVCMHVCVHLFVYICVHICLNACGGLRLVLRTPLVSFWPYLPSQGLSANRRACWYDYFSYQLLWYPLSVCWGWNCRQITMPTRCLCGLLGNRTQVLTPCLWLLFIFCNCQWWGQHFA